MEKRKLKILVADDEVLLTNSLKSILSRVGYEVRVCYRGGEVCALVKEFQPDVVLLDIFLGDVNGIELMKRIQEEFTEIPVVMITANSDVSMAVRAMKEGAMDYVVKPFDLDILNIIIQKAVENAALRTSYRPQLQGKKSLFLPPIIAESEAMKMIMNLTRQYAYSNSTTVLIQGESGTGKELVARAIHQISHRISGPFISLNCGAIPRDLAESEFFGYEKGAFTGATEKLKQGKFELAHHGTLLLDEVGELSLDMQVKLLRVLEEKRFFRLGGTKEIEVDVRVLASSNRDLIQEVAAHRFREDLFYRLNVATITIPPLRERKEDVIPMTEAFLKEFSQKFNKTEFTLSPESKLFLENYPWRGNVRELRNALERIVLLHSPCEISAAQFSFLKTPENGFGAMHFHHETLPIRKDAHSVRDSIMKALEQSKGNQLQAAKILGLTRSKLRYRIEQLHIDISQYK
jgi:DNA-binding NtrC family response regulator